MKKFLSLFLALTLLSAFGTVAFAAKSPVGTKKHKVTVTTSYNDKTVVKSVEDGSNYTLNADTAEGFDFLKWTIDGNYDIISGDLSSAKIVIKPKGDISACAVYDKIEHKVTFKNDGEDEISSVDYGETLKLSVKNADKFGFLRWEISGNYEIVSGSLDSAELVIRPLGDIVVNKVFNSEITPDVSFDVTINRATGATENAVVGKGDTYTLIASNLPKGYEFSRWEINGKYEIVSGSLTSKKVVIKPKSDVTVTELTEKAAQGAANTSDKSPKTGDSIPAILSSVLVVALAVFAISGKIARKA